MKAHQFELDAFSMASMNNTFPGDENKGTQVGSNYGHIHQVNNYCPPERTQIKPKPSSTVPFRRDPDFVDREILAEVEERCSRPASRAALVGLGGVGKSQLAIEYSYRIRNKSPQTWIFWVHASNAARFEQGYRTIADRIELPRRDEPKADILRLVSNWLSDESNGRWVMILDNADDSRVFLNPHKDDAESDFGAAASLATFLPQTPNGSILVTSRSRDTALRLTGRHQDIIEVDPMDEDHALLLFKNKFGGESDKNDTKELLQALDYMPLAISQAAAYISQRAPRTTVAGYLHDFRKSDKSQTKLLNQDTGDLWRDSSASNSIITTWQISFDYLRNNRPSAARLLSLMSFFDRQGIPESLLHRYDDREDGSDIDPNYDDREDSSNIGSEDNAGSVDLEDDSDITFEDDVFSLTSYSLIKANAKDGQFEMHRLVQLSTRKWLQHNSELEKWKKKYIKIIWNALPDGEYENWTTCRAIFPHAEAVLAYRPTKRTHLVFWSEVLDRAGWYAAEQAKYLMAEEMSRRALDGSEKALGKDHPKTLMCVNNLALVLRDQGKYEAAEEMSRRALDGRERALGKEHPHTLRSIANLALVLRNQRKYEAAEEMSRRALDGREKALGMEHPDTLMSIANLAFALRDQGEYEAAEEMSRRGLDGREKVLGKEHPLTLMSVGNLGSMLQDQGKYEAAEEMSRRAVDGLEKIRGKEHPDTLMSVHNLGYLMHQQKRYKDAIPLYERACAGRQKVLGTNHPHTLESSRKYASMIEEMNEADRRSLVEHLAVQTPLPESPTSD